MTLLPEMDDQPKNGYYAPELSELNPTAAEMAAGNALGAQIDIDDDEDNGGV